MAWYKCFIEGENFPGSLLQRSGLVGFFTSRTSEAPSAEAAELIALDLLRADPIFGLEDQSSPADAKIYFTDIVEVDGPSGPNTGMTWFPMDSPTEQDMQR